MTTRLDRSGAIFPALGYVQLGPGGRSGRHGDRTALPITAGGVVSDVDKNSDQDEDPTPGDRAISHPVGNDIHERGEGEKDQPEQREDEATERIAHPIGEYPQEPKRHPWDERSGDGDQ